MGYYECDPEGWRIIYRRWQRDHLYEPMSMEHYNVVILSLAFAGYVQGDAMRVAERRKARG